MNAKIHVRFVVGGMHRWAGAPENRAYLRDVHRHLFNVEVSTGVKHDEREIEFHDLLELSQSIFTDKFRGDRAVDRSCETMARELAIDLVCRFARRFEVSVFEDGECGATVVIDPQTKTAPGG